MHHIIIPGDGDTNNAGRGGVKVRDLKVFIVGNPPPGFGGNYFIFVKLTTDDNVTGIGEV